jgi:hypothetical protein
MRRVRFTLLKKIGSAYLALKVAKKVLGEWQAMLKQREKKVTRKKQLKMKADYERKKRVRISWLQFLRDSKRIEMKNENVEMTSKA